MVEVIVCIRNYLGWFSVDINNQIHEKIQGFMKGSAYIFQPIRFSSVQGLLQSKVLIKIQGINTSYSIEGGSVIPIKLVLYNNKLYPFALHLILYFILVLYCYHSEVPRD